MILTFKPGVLFIVCFKFSVPVNSTGHVGALSPLYGTSSQYDDAMTLKCTCTCIHNHPSKRLLLIMYRVFDFDHFSWASSDLLSGLSVIRLPVSG